MLASMPVSIPQLEALGALERTGSFSKAARTLHVTQPAITQHVANLSRHYGVQLVDTIDRRPVLTEAGRFLAERGAAIVESLEALEREMQEYADARSGVLSIGATVTIGTYLLPAMLAKLRAERPSLRVEAAIANTARIAHLVRTHEIGLALIEGAVEDDLIATAFREDELVLVVPAEGNPLSRKRRVAPQDLRGVPFVSRERGSGTRDLGYDALTRAGIAPPIVLELPSGEAILRAVEEGLGAAILSRLVVERELYRERIRIVPVTGLRLRRPLYAVRAPGKTLSPAQRALLRIVLGTEPSI